MTPTELKALHLLKDKGRMRAAVFAEEMGWPGKSTQGAARVGVGYIYRLAKKGLVDIHYRSNPIPGVPSHLQNTGYYAQINMTGEKVLIEEQASQDA